MSRLTNSVTNRATSGVTGGSTRNVEIKICGITRVQDALAAVDVGAAMLGLNFYPQSPRCITLERAQEIAQVIAGVSQVKLVGVFVNMDLSEVLRIARAVPLDAVQLHGDETRSDCELVAQEFEVIRALKADAAFTADRVAEFACCRGLLVDTPCSGHGGSGESFAWADVPWATLRRVSSTMKFFLAGGLDAGNVGEAIAAAHPDVVDVCSGVEAAKGIKSVSQMQDFVAAVRAAERHGQ
jgi:phosphoribosylanthranilate isomerase